MIIISLIANLRHKSHATVHNATRHIPKDTIKVYMCGFWDAVIQDCINLWKYSGVCEIRIEYSRRGRSPIKCLVLKDEAMGDTLEFMVQVTLYLFLGFGQRLIFGHKNNVMKIQRAF